MSKNGGLHVSQRCVGAIKGWETGAKRDPISGKQTPLPHGEPALVGYLCPSKVWTAGWGSTRGVNQRTVWTRPQAEAAFGSDIMMTEQGVRQLLGDVPTAQGQFDALVSFAFNVGLDIDADTKAEGLGDSTLLKLHLLGRYADAAKQFDFWDHGAGGVVLAGLEERRATERGWYEGK